MGELTVEEEIKHCIELAKDRYKPSRELSLVITKLEEAIHWLREAGVK